MEFDMSVEPESVAIAALQELCKRLVEAVMALEHERRDVMIERESLRRFSYYVSEIKTLLQALQSRGVERRSESVATRQVLQSLDLQLRQACDTIERHKSGSRIWLLLNFDSLLQQMERSARDISATVSTINVANHSVAHGLKTKIDRIASDLKSLEFRSAAATEAIVLEIEKSMTQSGRSREHTNQLLWRIAEALGVSANAAVVKEELELLQRQKEEMELREQQAEALQLSQLICLLSSSDMVSQTNAPPSNQEPQCSRAQEASAGAKAQSPVNWQQDLISSFRCPLSGEVMEDPVAILCGHSFERIAIQKTFERGESRCPVCQEELESLDITLNISLRSTIQEWRKRDSEMKLRRAVSGVASVDPGLVNSALEDLRSLMETEYYRAVVTEQRIVPNIVGCLKDGSGINTNAALKCLCYLASYSDENKKSMVEARVVTHIQKLFRRGEALLDAIAVLLALSEKDEFAEEIGRSNECIPFLVSLLQNHDLNISKKAEKVVENLSSNTHFVIKMSEAGYFMPFLTRFKQGPLETQDWMSVALAEMPLTEKKVKVFENKQFAGALVRVLSSGSPANRSACLKYIKKLSAYPSMAKWFLAEAATIPALLGLISFVSSDPEWRLSATEILTSLIQLTELSNFESNPNLQELQSRHNIGVFLHFIITSTSPPETKAQFLHLLHAIGNKSGAARDLIRSDKDAITHLYASLAGNHWEIIGWTLELLYCLAVDHPNGLPLPPSPAKELAINTLVTILTNSTDDQDRSIAAGIISKLPMDDATVNDILSESELLKAIREVICTTDSMHFVGSQNGALLENALAALLRYTETNKPNLTKQLSDLQLYPPLVRMLSNGSSRAKQCTATVLARLSQPMDTTLKISNTTTSVPLVWLASLLPTSSWCCNSASALLWTGCSIHGSACSSRQTFCIVKADAVRPLVQMLKEGEAAEAAFLALETMLTDQSTLSHAASTIVESQGIPAILEVLERGSPVAKDKALDVFHTISQYTNISRGQFRRAERVLIQLLQVDNLKKKAALLLSDMDVISKQSSFF